MSTVIRRPSYSAAMPGAPARNGLPGFRPYVYRGTGRDELTAWMDDEAARPHREPGGFRTLKGCGTTAAYRRHLRRGEDPCEECREAERFRLAPRKGAYNEARRARYAAARAAGLSAREASRVKGSQEAAA